MRWFTGLHAFSDTIKALGEICAAPASRRVVHLYRDSIRTIRDWTSARPILDDPRVAVTVRVVDVEPPVRPVLRVERKPEETLLAARLDASTDVEKRLRANAAGGDDADPPGLLDDVQAAGFARRRRESDRGLET